MRPGNGRRCRSELFLNPDAAKTGEAADLVSFLDARDLVTVIVRERIRKPNEIGANGERLPFLDIQSGLGTVRLSRSRFDPLELLIVLAEDRRHPIVENKLNRAFR